jgi:hypothetical protein
VIRPEPFSKSLSLANCQKACQSDAKCTAVTVARTNGNGPGPVTDDILLDGLIKAVDADGFNGAGGKTNRSFSITLRTPQETPYCFYPPHH